MVNILKDKENSEVLLTAQVVFVVKRLHLFKHKGFNNVYQLNGGIIGYAQTVKETGMKINFKAKTLFLTIAG